MSTFKKFLVFVLFLALTNLLTFALVSWRGHQRLQGQRQLVTAATDRTAELEQRLAEAEAELERLSVWGDFITFQHDVGAVVAEIERLNFGNAIDQIDGVQRKLELGEYGTTFRQHRPALAPMLDQAQVDLRERSDQARQRLVDLEERAFGLLIGIAPPPERAPQPEAPMAPTPEPEEVPEPEVAAEEPES